MKRLLVAMSASLLLLAVELLLRCRRQVPAQIKPTLEKMILRRTLNTTTLRVGRY